MSYFTNYDVIYNNGNPVLEMRAQACLGSLKVDETVEEVSIWIFSKLDTDEFNNSHHIVSFEEIEKYINLLIKCGFNITLDKQEYTSKFKKGQTYYATLYDKSYSGYKVTFPAKNNKKLVLFYATYIRYIYEDLHYDNYIKALYKLEENLPYLNSELLITLAEYCHNYQIGAGHSGSSLKMFDKVYYLPTVKEREEYIIKYPDYSMQDSIIFKGVAKKSITYGNTKISNFLNDNKFEKILDIFDLKEVYKLKEEIIQKEKEVVKKKNLRSRKILRLC